MTLYDYLQKCLKNDEFRELWEEAVKEMSEDSVTEDVDICEASILKEK